MICMACSQVGTVPRAGPSHASGMLWAERLVLALCVDSYTVNCAAARWNKLGKNLSKATKGWASGFAEKFGQYRHLALEALLQNPSLAAPPPYVRDDVEVWLGGEGTRMMLTQFDGWQERIGALWKGALGHPAPGTVMSTSVVSHDTVVIGGVMFRCVLNFNNALYVCSLLVLCYSHRTRQSHANLKTDNSGIIMPIVYDNDETIDRFGELRGIYEHRRVDGAGERAVFLDVKWLKPVKLAVRDPARARVYICL